MSEPMSEPFTEPLPPPFTEPIGEPLTEGCLARVYAPRARRPFPFPSPFPSPMVMDPSSSVPQTVTREAHRNGGLRP